MPICKSMLKQAMEGGENRRYINGNYGPVRYSIIFVWDKEVIQS